MKEYDLIVIGGGSAGLAAAKAAYDKGIKDILIIERDDELGGILNQCIHNGFGLHSFGEELTGPEYAARYIKMIKERNIEYKLGTMVIDISSDRIVTAVNKDEGMLIYNAKAVILAMGCRERPRGALNIPGFRPAGIYTAGTAQRLVNREGFMPGRRVVVLGSGDIGLIMARRLTLEGAKVLAVAELMPYSGGLKRNIVQCLDDFGIPLILSHTVVDIKGKERLTGVTLAEVGPDGRVVKGTEKEFECDTLLLSVGLIPENELSLKAGLKLSNVTNGPLVDDSLQTGVPGIFAAGNVLHVNDLVDHVTEEGITAGESAAEFITKLKAGETVNPPEVRDAFAEKVFELREKAKSNGRAPEPGTREITCIKCPNGCLIKVSLDADTVTDITGYRCPKGKAYAESEIYAPVRTVTSTLPVSGGRDKTVSVKTSGDIPKEKITECMDALTGIVVNVPVHIGDIIIKDVAGTGADIIATKDIEAE